ncbi:MAG: 50S ribosomal protein L9 [Flavobacteriales bacterium Tduv]
MRIILKKDVENLGFKYDQLSVKPGYARNYLIPKGYALVASPGSIKELNEVLKQRSKKQEVLIQEAKKTVEKLNVLNVKIPVKVGAGGKLFGSVHSNDLVEILEKENIHIDKKFIRLGNAIKVIGKYQANIRLNSQVEVQFSFEVVPANAAKDSKK